MPYGEDENHTPNGCSSRNGRCFSLIEYSFDYDIAVFTFGDGSRYTWIGINIQRLYEDYLHTWDPGCRWNAFGPSEQSPPFFYRGEPPADFFPDIAAAPPYYEAILNPSSCYGETPGPHCE